MEFGNDINWEAHDLADLLTLGKGQVANLTFYKLVFNALDQLARDHASSEEVYHQSLMALVSGYLASLNPQYLPQAVAAKNLLLKKVAF